MKENKEDYVNKLILDATVLLKEYFKQNYTFGLDCLDTVGRYISEFGKSTLLIISKNRWAKPLRSKILEILNKFKIKIVAEAPAARPNAPIEDVASLTEIVKKVSPESITCVGGGSAIDCAKAANVFASLAAKSDDINSFFGVGEVSKVAERKNKGLYPLIAVMVAAGSAAHLTKHSNITFTKSGEKKLISDDIIIPDRAVFDYKTTLTTPLETTLDGAMDGLSHCLEVYYSISPEKNGKEEFENIKKACLTAISLIVEVLPVLTGDLKNLKYRHAVGLATDLGGYALIKGWTNMPHVNSFGMVDIVSHGRACGLLNPYYTVFFAPAIREKLVKLLVIYRNYVDKENLYILDYLEDSSRGSFKNISSRQIGETVAKAMINFASKLGFPVKLDQVKGFSDIHIDRMMGIAKSPRFENRLKNMPIPLEGHMIDKYILPVILAAKSGNFSLIPEVR
ncbi:MAG: iron-containing alcohol dehydrogenase [Actinobacteria bacterium]|nr:iron-containing alcohol dehydrogenase [Actinomycetota bacterium]